MGKWGAAIAVLALAACSSAASKTAANTNAASSSSSSSSTTGPVYTSPPTSFSQCGGIPNCTLSSDPLPTTPPPATVPAAPDEVTYDCAGNAPGVDISYGDDSSNLQGRLPLHVVAPLSPDAQYYAINAQLGGSGTVTCRVTVHFNGGETATKVGTAAGGYNIAGPEVCSTFDGGFEAC